MKHRPPVARTLARGLRAWTGLCLLAACSTVSNAPDAAAQVLALEHALCEAYLHGDVPAMQRGLADDFTLVNGRGGVSTKAEDIESARTGSVRYRRFENSESRVRIYGSDAAVVTGITSVAGATAAGREFELRVRFTDTYVRQDGRWLLAASQASSALPAGG